MKRMRRLILAVALCLALPALCFGFFGFKTVVSAQAIAASGSYTSAAVDTGTITATDGWAIADVQGYFSLQLTIAGSGTAKAEVTVSNDGTTFVTAEGASAIMTGKTAGTYLSSFTMPVCKAFKIVITETGGANGVTATAIVAAQ